MGSIQYRPEEIKAMYQAFLMDMRFEQLRRMEAEIYSLCPIALVFDGSGNVSTQPYLSEAQKGIIKQLAEIRNSIIEKDYPMLSEIKIHS